MSTPDFIKLLRTDSLKLPLETVRRILSEELSKPPAEMDTELVDLCTEAIEKAEAAERSKRLTLLFKQNSEKLPAQSVCQILSDELSEPPEKMDTELIDLCARALNGEKELPKTPPEPSGRKKVDHKKLLILVAIISALLIAILPSFASKLRIRAARGTVSVSDSGNFQIDFGKLSTKAETYPDKKIAIVAALCKEGVENPVLPENLLDGDLKLSVDKTVEEDDCFIATVNFVAEDNSVDGFVRVIRYTDPNYSPGKIGINGCFNSVKQNSFNGIDAVTFVSDDGTITYYASDNAEYTVFLA